MYISKLRDSKETLERLLSDGGADGGAETREGERESADNATVDASAGVDQLSVRLTPSDERDDMSVDEEEK